MTTNREENLDLTNLILSALEEDDFADDDSGYWGRRGFGNQFDFVNPQLAIGGCAYNDEQRKAVVDAGITHILDCRIERNDRMEFRALAPHVTYMWLGTDDDGRIKPDWWFANILDFAKECYSSGGVLLTHCAIGINRGPSAGYVILRHIFDMTHTQAMTAMRAARPITEAAYAVDADSYLRRIGATSRLRRKG